MLWSLSRGDSKTVTHTAKKRGNPQRIHADWVPLLESTGGGRGLDNKMIFNHTCPNPLNNLFRNLRYHGEAHFFPPEEKNKCCLVTCYPPKFCIYPDFSPCIDLPRSASPIKAFSGKAGRFGPPPPHLFLFLSLLLYLFFRKDIYSYISHAHDIHKSRQQATRQHFRSTAFRDKCKIKAGNR